LLKNPLYHACADAELPADLEHAVAGGLQFEYPDDEACGRVLGLTERRQSAALASGHEKSCLKVAAICSSAQST
jgi:hypothetical protein